MHASLQSLQFYWGIMFALLILIAVMRREQLNNWLWFVTAPKLAAAGICAVGMAAVLVFIVNGPVALGR